MLKKNQIIAFVAFILFIPMLFVTKTNIFSLKNISKKAGLYDIKDYLVNVNIDAPKNLEGEYIIVNGTQYTVNLRFEEKKGKQFPNDGEMYYELPSGLNVIESQQSRFFDIMVRSGDENLVIHNNKIRIENGKVYIRWAMEDPNIEALFNKKNVYFYIDFKCMFDETTQIIKFNDNIDVTLTFDNENNISIDKESIVSNYEEGRIKYYVTIESHGNNRDVIITDNLVGNNFELLPYSFTATSNLNSGDQWSHSIVGNSYNYNIPSMSNGEVITISYEVIVKPSVREISLEQPYLIEKIHNDVSVRSSTNDNVNTDSIENEITFRPKISKTEGRLLSKEGNKEIVGWNIIINDDNLFDITGLTVKDIINVPERDYMKMSGEGIRVYVYDTNSHLIATYEVPWNDDSLTKNDYSWEYMIPDTYNDELYSYTISYITEVDKSGIEETVKLYNTAYFEEETSSNYYETIKSSTNILEIDKNAKEIDLKNNEVTWEISIDVPENGISPATMVDTLPGKYNTYTSSFMYDDYIDGSLTVDNLIGEENYDLSLEGNRLTIDFYKDREKTEKGLFGFPNGRRIIIRLKTKINQEWVNMVNTASDYSGHTNYVDFAGKNDNASVIISPKKLEKKVEKVSEIIEGVEYEAYRYDIIFSNITEDTFEIEDIFDTELLGLLKEGYIGKISVCGGNIYYQGDCIDNQINYINTSSGIKFIFQPSDLKKDINGNYYPSYRLSYSLIPKNSAAINKLNEYAAKEVDGIYNIQNTAEWGGLTATANAEYIYNGFSKQLEDDNNGEDDYYTFTLNINPSGKYMNNKNELEIHDIYENMSVDFSSININPSEGVSYYSSGYELIFTIPDGQPTTITYRAKALFDEGASEGDSVRISNTAYIKDLGYEQSTSKVVEKSISGGGGASDYYLDIIKVEGENFLNRLEGASFDFYDSDHNYITTLTTDNDGKIRILFENTDFYDFEVDKNYYFKEKTPPRGYKKINTEYRFKVSSDGYINYSDYTYTSGDWVTVKNYKEEMTELTIIKEWDDDDNQKGKRPNSIDMTLSNGDIVTLNEENGWTSTIEVPKYDSNNNLIEYTWSEPIISGYEKVDEKVVGGITTITNSLLDEETSFSIEKIDSSDSEKFLAGAKFELHIVNLDDDANIVSDSLLSEGITQADGTITFNDLDMFTENNNGQLYYFVETEAPEGYELDELKYYFILYDGGSTTAQQRAWVFDDIVSNINNIDVRTFTNDYTYIFPNNIKQNTVAIDVNKIWADNNDQDGIRPESITFTLLKNGTAITDKTCTANASTSWSCTIDDLDEYENGEKINYSIGELDLIDGYETGSAVSIGNNSFSITNVHTPETTDVTVTKVWNDANDQDGIRPTSITMQLLADGEEVEGKTVTLTNDKLIDTITGLPKYNKSTTPIEYTWSESTLPEGYEMTSNVTNGEITAITNTHIPETTDVTATKIWADNNNQDGIRPESITFTLLKNGTAVTDKTCTANESTNWSCTIENLDEYENGEKINYSITELDSINGYETGSAVSIDENSFTIANVHEPETTRATIRKVWVDADNQDGIRPESITMQLLADGEEVEGKTVTLTNDKLTDTIKGLPKYNNSTTPIKYTWSESTLPEGYEMTSNVTKVEITTITNIHIPETTDVTVTKVWNDANDQDGIRPTSITMQLLADGEEVEGKTVTLTNDKLTDTITGLPKYNKSTTPINYTWSESTLPEGYEMTSNVTNGEITTITNTHISKTVEVTATKIWADNNNQDGIRPESITFTLLKNGTAVTDKTCTANESTNWSCTIDNLDEYENGEKINYSIGELDLIDGYETGNAISIGNNSFSITNVHEPETTEATITKVWEDEDDQDGIRPESITMQLLADGEEVEGKTVTLTNDKLTDTITGLPKYNNGAEIVYTWSESTLPEGYEMTSNVTNEKITTITNTHIPETTEATVTKVWNDANDQDGIRPTSITMQLLADGEEVEGKTVTLTNDKLTDTITGLPKYNKSTTPIEYTWSESTLPEGYEMTSNVTNGEITTITNTHIPETTEATVTKVWDDANDQDGIRPTSITMQLLADGEEVEGKTVTLTNDKLTDTITGLPKYNKSTTPIEYTWSESTLPEGYEMTSNVTNGKITTITNTHISKTVEVTATKIWADNNNQDGIRPESITFTLLKNGTAIADKTCTAKASTNWSCTMDNLDEYENGEKINYSIVEMDLIEGYEASSAVSIGDNSFSITNVHTPAKTTFNVNKIWDDKNNQDGKRPNSITVHLLADGTVINDYTLDESNNWMHTFENLDKYNNGKQIVYSVIEENIDYYSTSISGGTITNTYAPEKTSYTVIKRWEDANDQDGIRPDSINIALLANGEEIEEIELTSEKGWTHTFSNLDKYSSGEIIEYSVKEITVPNGYNSEVSGNTIINQHTPELKSISGKKTWEDQDDFRKLRPKKITICLYADGIKQTCKDVSIDDNWEYTFNDLPKYNRGIEINYSLVEEPVEYYKAEIDGYNITNKYTPKENSNDNRPPINNPVTKDRSIIVIIITAISYIGYILFRFKKKMVK